MMAITQDRKLAADTALPQRDLLLDESEVARRLAHNLGLGEPLRIDACERIRTKYRFGHSLRVLHRLSVGSAVFTVAARAFKEGHSARAYERSVSQAVATTPLRPVIHDAELGTVFWTFPNDRKLTALHALVNIPADLAQGFIPAWTQSRIVAYAPEKCATAQCLDGQSKVFAYAKLYAGAEGRRVADLYAGLHQSLKRARSALSLPHVISYKDAYRLLLLEAVEGERLADLRGAEARRGYERLGSALAELHSLPVPAGLSPFKRLDPERTLSAASIISLACPDLRREAEDLSAELAARWESPAGAQVCLHGDLHPKNVLLFGDRLTLLDLDQAGAGRPAADLGSLLARLSYSHLSGLIPKRLAEELSDSFLAGYGRVRTLPQKTCLNWHMSAALLAERALRAVNRIRPEGLDCMRELLIEAHHILRTGGRR